MMHLMPILTILLKDQFNGRTFHLPMLARWHSVMHILEHKVSPAFYIVTLNRIIDLPTRVSLTPLKSGGYLLHDHRAVVHYGQHHEKLQRGRTWRLINLRFLVDLDSFLNTSSGMPSSPLLGFGTPADHHVHHKVSSDFRIEHR
jgi:hypothetical protein